MGSLLMLVAARLPFDCPANVADALVLFAVSTASVVFVWNVVVPALAPMAKDSMNAARCEIRNLTLQGKAPRANAGVSNLGATEATYQVRF
jgi:hypothetical protein